MDILEKNILDSISIIREKRPGAKSIFKHLLVLQILPWKLSKKVLNY